jgi:DNA processing protein
VDGKAKDELARLLTLCSCRGIGPVAVRRLLEGLPELPRDPRQLKTSELTTLGLNKPQIAGLKSPDQAQVDKALDWLEKSPNHHILTLVDASYPALLAEAPDPPPILYALGRIELLQSPQIAMVGSRNCTPGGASTAHDFGEFLAASGLTITSGLALGIDRHSHQGALDATGNTIAVIGTGIDRVYPAANRQLAHQIAERGLIVSEFPLGTAPTSSNFPKRNRIISGLALATLVVEAARNSGSLITARLALEQGRDVFAIPGSIHNPMAKGCHQLIRDGAKLVDQASDIIDDIGALLGYVANQVEAPERGATDNLDPEYLQLLDCIGYDPVSMDTLVNRSGLTVEQLSSMLLILELNDRIKPASGGLYVRC